MSELAARLYALLHRGSPGDVAHYRRVCEGSDEVLELGCGAGRVALPLARAGHHVVGLDHDGAMLELAAEELAEEHPEVVERLGLHKLDMRGFALGRRFDRVIVPHNSLLCLLSREELHRCLVCVREHLSPEGTLWLDVYGADAFHAEDHDAEEDDEPIVAIEHEGTVYTVYEQSSLDRPSQRIDVHYRFVPQGNEAPLTLSIAQRYLLASELEEALAAAGLALVARWGGFSGEPWEEDAELMIIGARLASEAPALGGQQARLQ